MIKKRQTSAKMARIISVHTAVRLIIIHFEAMAYEDTLWGDVFGKFILISMMFFLSNIGMVYPSGWTRHPADGEGLLRCLTD